VQSFISFILSASCGKPAGRDGHAKAKTDGWSSSANKSEAQQSNGRLTEYSIGNFGKEAELRRPNGWKVKCDVVVDQLLPLVLEVGNTWREDRKTSTEGVKPWKVRHYLITLETEMLCILEKAYTSSGLVICDRVA
jgi:hypothetical protein